MDFLSVADDSLYILTHCTKDEVIADHIIKEGFEYSNTLHFTTDEMINDDIYVNYWLKQREHYGNSTVVICISKKIYKKYMELSKIHKMDYEYILSDIPPYCNDDGDMIYLLSKHYIKGYFNNKTEEMVYNIKFDPLYDSPQYLRNIIDFTS